MGRVVRCGDPDGRGGFHREPAPWRLPAAPFPATVAARCQCLFLAARRHPPSDRRPVAKPRLCRVPAAPFCAGHRRALQGQHGGRDRPAHPRGTAWRDDDDGRPCRIPAGETRTGMRALARLPRLRAAAAFEWGGHDRIVEPAGAHRYRRAWPGRSAGLVSFRRGQQADVCRPRCLFRRWRFRRRPGRGIA